MAVSLPLLLGLLLWPAGPAGAVADEVWHSFRADIRETLDLPGGFSELLVFAYFISGALSLWYLILGLVFWRFPSMPEALFAPFLADGRRAGARLALPGGLAFALWLAFTLHSFPVGEWAAQWRQQLRDEDRAASAYPDPRSRSAAVHRVELDRNVQERRAKQVAADFLRPAAIETLKRRLNSRTRRFMWACLAATCSSPTRSRSSAIGRGSVRSSRANSGRWDGPTRCRPRHPGRVV